MKKIIFGLAVTAALLVQLNSCKKDNDDSVEKDKTAAIPAGFVCKIDGIDFKADSTQLDVSISGLSVTAFKAGTGAFQLDIYGETLGKYSLDAANMQASATYFEGATQVEFYSLSGDITLATVDSIAKSISGTFNFVSSKIDGTKRTITAGSFNVKK